MSHNSQAFGDSQAVQTGVFAEVGRFLAALTLTNQIDQARQARDWPFEAELFVKDRFSGLVAFKDAKQAETV